MDDYPQKRLSAGRNVGLFLPELLTQAEMENIRDGLWLTNKPGILLTRHSNIAIAGWRCRLLSSMTPQNSSRTPPESAKNSKRTTAVKQTGISNSLLQEPSLKQ